MTGDQRGLAAFRDHCRKMAVAEHKPECKWPDARLVAQHNVRQATFERTFSEPKGTRPLAEHCLGCVTAADRALFAQMAGEVDDYLAPQVDLFGDVTAEPTMEDA